jgi:hypothetical protein
MCPHTALCRAPSTRLPLLSTYTYTHPLLFYLLFYLHPLLHPLLSTYTYTHLLLSTYTYTHLLLSTCTYTHPRLSPLLPTSSSISSLTYRHLHASSLPRALDSSAPIPPLVTHTAIYVSAYCYICVRILHSAARPRLVCRFYLPHLHASSSIYLHLHASSLPRALDSSAPSIYLHIHIHASMRVGRYTSLSLQAES